MFATGDDLARISVGLEEGPDGRFLAHGLNLPGCSGLGPSPRDALREIESEMRHWLGFLATAGERVPPPEREIVISVDEWLRAEAEDPRDATPVLFAADLPPITTQEIERGLYRLGEMRRRLLVSVRRRRDAELDVPALEGRTTVRALLDELAHGHWWTLSRLGASPMAEVPDRIVGRLDTSMALIVDRFVNLAEDRRAQVLVLDREEWTPRKVLRRLLWLEWTIDGAVLDALGVAGPATN